MNINWNTVKDRAKEFQSFWGRELKQATNLSSFEKSNSTTFLIDFFNVFGIDKKRVAQFEQSVDRFSKTIAKCNGKRLTWKALTERPDEDDEMAA